MQVVIVKVDLVLRSVETLHWQYIFGSQLSFFILTLQIFGARGTEDVKFGNSQNALLWSDALAELQKRYEEMMMNKWLKATV